MPEVQPTLEEQLQEAKELLSQLTAPPFRSGVVLSITDKYVTISGPNGTLDLAIPKKIKLTLGQTVQLHAETSQIIAIKDPIPVGSIVSVSEIVDDTRIQVSAHGHTKCVLSGDLKDIKEGDRILLDVSDSIAILKLPDNQKSHSAEKAEKITWDQVGGHAQAKQDLIEAVELPLKHPEIFKAYGKRPAKGILLYGPPGCGKTLLAKAVATSVATTAKEGAPSGFIYIKGPEVLDPYVGVAEATVRELFRRAKAHKEQYGVQAVLFIDEAEALLGNRGAFHAHMEKTIVPAFLAEMDGLEESGAFVVLATNRPDALDPAVVREGRIDKKVYIGRPHAKECADILKIYLKDVPMVKGLQLEDACLDVAARIFSKDLAYKIIHTQEGEDFTLYFKHLVSGALLATLADLAVSIALHRDIAGKSKKATGITIDDLMEAVDRLYQSNRHVDHTEAIRDLLGPRTPTHIRSMNHEAEVG